MAEIHPTATVYPGTVLGDNVRVLENAVVGKQPSLGASSTAKRDPLPPTAIGDGTVISTDEPLKLECQEFLRLIAGDGDRRKVAEDGARVVRALDRLTESLG